MSLSKLVFPRVFHCVLALAASTPSLVCAQESGKSDPIATDRPDFVESGQVVGRGRFQFESGLSYDRSKQDGIKTNGFNTPALFRFGVADTWELRLETDGFIRAKTEMAGFPSTSQSGFGDIALGTKWQMQEADEKSGRPAIAWLLHADLETGSNEFKGQGVRPSLRMVAEWELPGDVSVGIMPGIVLEKNADGKRYNMGILAITASRPLAEGWRGFIELSGQQIQSKSNGGNVTTFDMGVTHLLSNDVQVDAWISKGLTKAAPTVAAGVGFAIRF